MKDPYKILGLSPDADEQILQSTYNGLKTRYSEERFLDGELGNEGARKLMELEEAWVMISYDLQQRQTQNEFGSEFGKVDALIKSGDYDAAQSLLDSVSVRTAEWHYYQSIIYYKREWLSESRKQLVMAVTMDPSNVKYAEALSRMDSIIGNPSAQQQTMGQQPNQNIGNDAANTLCRCCQAYLCADCLCTMCSLCCRM